MKRLLVLGSAPCMEQDIAGLDLSAYDVIAVNRAACRYGGVITHLVSYHPQDMINEDWPGQRKATGGNDDYQIVLHKRHRWCEKQYGPVEIFTGPSQTGSSTLLAVLFGQHLGYDSILVAGAPLEGDYATFQDGWIQKKRVLAGRVESLSGWTKTFLEGLK